MTDPYYFGVSNHWSFALSLDCVGLYIHKAPWSPLDTADQYNYMLERECKIESKHQVDNHAINEYCC